MLYLVIKHLHVTCVVLSISGFCLRGLLQLRKSALAERYAGRRWLRRLPHINDSLLLAAALTLTVLTGQYPFVDAWLTAKVFGLIAYIIFGALALQAGRPPRLRIAAGIAAVGVFGWIVSVALTKNPLGLLA
jgi:uncharacterized membrane protein SirB2